MSAILDTTIKKKKPGYIPNLCIHKSHAMRYSNGAVGFATTYCRAYHLCKVVEFPCTCQVAIKVQCNGNLNEY